jgi:bifunctional DNA-binding transcriptional regulator/antitoxin component of YhaV-PrlF toxin-antitoxin module
LTKVAESKVSAQWATAVPSEVRPWLKVKTGDVIEWHVIDGHVEVRKK